MMTDINHSRKWVISEADLLHLMSVKIGAPYVSVQDASKRTSIVVEPLATAIAAPAQRPADDALWDQTLQERDTYHDWADKLADAIGLHLGVDVGEHTSLNNPWNEALDAIMSAPSLAELSAAPAQSGEPVADLVLRCKELEELATCGESKQIALNHLANTYNPDISAHDRKAMARNQTHHEAMQFVIAAPQPSQPVEVGDYRLGAFVRKLAVQLADSPKSFLANVQRAITDLDGAQSAVVLDDERAASRTAGMTLGERIAHVGGRTNAAGYIEFGSVQAVNALVEHVLRDARAASPQATVKRVYFKRSEFRHVKPSGWVTFNVRAEDADDAEKLLSGGLHAAAPQASALTDDLRRAIVSLELTAAWLDGGCDTLRATAEIRAALDRLRVMLAAHPTGKAEDAQAAATPTLGIGPAMTPFGMLVRALRIVAGTTLYDMAKHLSSTPATLSAIEFGRKPLTDAMVADTAAYFSGLGIHDTLHALKTAAQPESGGDHAD